MSFDDYKKRNASRCYPPAVVLGLVNECDRLFLTFISKSISNLKTGGTLAIRYVFLDRININHILFQFMIEIKYLSAFVFSKVNVRFHY